VKIAVNLGGIHNWHAKDPKNLFEVALRVVGFVSQRNACASEALADYVIRPDLSGFGPYELDRSDEMIRVGYECARRAAPDILAVVRKARTDVDEGDWKRVVRWLRKHSPAQAFGRRAS
jgi:predicted acylesterase/phospholipase RssA